METCKHTGLEIFESRHLPCIIKIIGIYIKQLFFTRNINIFTCLAAWGSRKYERTSAIFKPWHRKWHFIRDFTIWKIIGSSFLIYPIYTPFWGHRQTVQIQTRRSRLWHLIRVCTVCICPNPTALNWDCGRISLRLILFATAATVFQLLVWSPISCRPVTTLWWSFCISTDRWSIGDYFRVIGDRQRPIGDWLESVLPSFFKNKMFGKNKTISLQVAIMITHHDTYIQLLH